MDPIYYHYEKGATEKYLCSVLTADTKPANPPDGAIAIERDGARRSFTASGGSWVEDASSAPAHNHPASEITSGTIAAARLGSGTPGAGNFLRGDSSWQAIAGGGDLLSTNNLSDLANAGTARTNLGLGTAATTAATDYATAAHAHAGVYEPANANIQSHVTAAHAPSTAQANADITKAEIEAKLTGQISSHTHAGGSEAFPVGSVFIAVVSTNPGTLLGYGTWSAFGAGRVMVGLDAADPDFDTAEETGGAKTVTLTGAQSGLPQHTHVQDAHSHNLGHVRNATTGAATTNIAKTPDTSSTLGTGTLTDNATAVNQNAGPANAAEAHSNVQPYITVYMWKRTA